MKTLHLVCNSHLDPVWQWDWDEGASASLATFYSVCELADKYDYIFCHNEVILYEYIEKYDKVLFERISKLIEEGKWHIMGGWYCQPDCLVPSGETYLRQISLGKEYFLGHFGKYPKTALNFDSFGHTRGLPQILKKSGFENYLFCRPLSWFTQLTQPPHGPFLWKGYDGSTVKALRQEDDSIYCSMFGEAKKDIIRKESFYDKDDEDNILILWGVGNHGGIQSEKDLKDILVLQDEKKGEWEIIHSTPDNYFDSVHPTDIFSKELIAFVKSYSSVSAIKQANDKLENAIYRAERFLTALDISGIYSYDKEPFKYAEKILCQIGFHDVLSGTAVKSGYDSSLRKALSAIEAVNEEFLKGFYQYAKDLSKTNPGDDSFVVVNTNPYKISTYTETELFEMDVRRHEVTMSDDLGNNIPCQVILEESSINFDRRIRLIYKVDLEPFEIKRYTIHTERPEGNRHIRYAGDTSNEDIIIKDKYKEITISRETGFVTSYKVGGMEYVSKALFVPTVFDDNEDPWGWRISSLGENLKPMKLDKSGKGLFEGLKGVTIIEDGNLLTQVECLYSKGESHVVIDYKIYHDMPYVDVNVKTIWNDRKKGLKLKFSINGDSKFFTESAYGIEYSKNNNDEKPLNRFTGVENGNKAFVIYNRSGVHSGAKKGKDLYLTLLNGSAYCAHPTDPGTPLIVDETRYYGFIEIGTHEHEFRIQVNEVNESERLAKEFNEPIYSNYMFPHGNGEVKKVEISISNPNVTVSAMKKLNNGSYMIRLFNNSTLKAETTLAIKNSSRKVSLSKYEFKTLVYDGKTIKESKEAALY